MRSPNVRRRTAHGVAAAEVFRPSVTLPFIIVMLAAAATVFVLLSTVLVSSAQAAELSATNLKVSIWPEYDDPRVLVIHQADLDPGVQLPTQVTFNIPKGAEIGMACEVNSAGGHACKPFRLEDKGDYQTLTYTVDKEKRVFLEYYYEAFPAGAEQRTFDYPFRPSFPAASTTIEVQEPLRSSGFSVDPTLSETYQGADGISYHSQVYADLPVGEPMPVSVAYTKSDSEPSVRSASSSGGQSTGPFAASAGGASNTGLIVLVAVALVAVSLGGYRLFRPAPASSGGRNRGTWESARSQSQGSRGTRAVAQSGNASRSQSRSVSSSGSRRARNEAGASKFCTSCGLELQREDNFCPECGEFQG